MNRAMRYDVIKHQAQLVFGFNLPPELIGIIADHWEIYGPPDFVQPVIEVYLHNQNLPWCRVASNLVNHILKQEKS